MSKSVKLFVKEEWHGSAMPFLMFDQRIPCISLGEEHSNGKEIEVQLPRRDPIPYFKLRIVHLWSIGIRTWV
jgi:hypothetical protein